MATSTLATKRFQSNITDTYFFLRFGMGCIAVALPLVLWLVGTYVIGIPPQTSMSAYYHTEMRDVFVGSLFAVGFALFIYKGFSRSEDWALNLAGLLAIGVAYFPMDSTKVLDCYRPCERPCLAYSDVLDRTLDVLVSSGLHGPFAILFFIAISYVCGFCSKRTLHLIPSFAMRRSYLWAYRILGVAMVAVPVAVAVLLRLSPNAGSACADRTVFWMEATGVWVFSVFWLLKTIEGYRYGADITYVNRRAIPEDRAKAI